MKQNTLSKDFLDILCYVFMINLPEHTAGYTVKDTKNIKNTLRH